MLFAVFTFLLFHFSVYCVKGEYEEEKAKNSLKVKKIANFLKSSHQKRGFNNTKVKITAIIPSNPDNITNIAQQSQKNYSKEVFFVLPGSGTTLSDQKGDIAQEKYEFYF